MKVLDIMFIDVEKIHENVNQPRETFDKEELGQMSKSIKKIGLLNPITVRPWNSGYQIIAGGRRFRSLKMLGEKQVQAKIVDADDIEADIMSIAENYHRKDLTVEEKEKSIYAAWIRGNDGKDKGIFKGKISIMSEWTGIPLKTLQTIISGGKEKEGSNSEIIKRATSEDLARTKSLEEIAPEVRKELLRLEQSNADNKIGALDLVPIVKGIKTAKDMNTSEDVIKKIPKLISEKKIEPTQTEKFIKAISQAPPKFQNELVEMLSSEKIIEPALDIEPVVRCIKIAKEANISDNIIREIPKLISQKKIKSIQTEDFIKAIAEAPSELQKDVMEISAKEKMIEPDKVKTFVNVLRDSEPDIQKKLLKKEIGLDEAKIANEFPREDQRNQIIEEFRTNRDENKKDFERHIHVRKRQSEEIEQGKEPNDLTIADIERFKKINANSLEQQDSRMLQLYRNQLINLMIKADDIKSMHFDANKKEAIDIIWKIYERPYKALVELGEIKVFGNINPRSSPVPPKKLYGI